MPEATGVPELPGLVVSPEWLLDQTGAVAAGDLVVADVRWYLDGRSGRAAYEAGHVPGARFVDLETVLAGPPGATGGRHPLPDPEAFAQGLGAAGVGEGTPVVAYDDSSGGTAGRLVWMLRSLGHPAALLDGGSAGWVAAGGALAGGPDPGAPRAGLRARPWPADRFVTADEVVAAVAAGRPVLDARAPERYRGETEPVDARAGHVPGARNAPWAATVEPLTGRFRPPDELVAHFAALGVVDATEAVAYCGSGVSACADLVAMAHAGLGDGRLYVGSWSGWSNDPERPVATGPTP